MPYSALFSALKSIPRHECFGIFIRELTRQVERRFPNPSPLKENSARAGTLIASRSIYRYTGDVVSGSLSCAMLTSYLISPHETPILVFITWAIFLVAYYLIPRLMANLLRSIPRHECFSIFIRELTRMVERRYPNPSPLKENSARAWTLIASRSIYNHIGDVVSGSLSCALLVSFLVSPCETTSYVFLVWTICLVAYYLIPWPMANLLRFCISILFVIIGLILSDSSLFEALWSALFWDLSMLPVILIIYANATLVMMLAFLFRSLAYKLRSIPQREGFGNLMEELTCIVEWRFPNSSPLVEITARTLTLVVSRSIYRCTRDVITGSLSCTILISFLISRDETPIYVFIIWGMCLAPYLKNNRALIPVD